MKITVYTIKDCAFSKQEKEYLNTNKLIYEEKDLEANKEFLTEMLAISNNFAGTPVTRVEKDDGTISVLKGFTKEEFDTTFGFAAAPVTSTGNQSPVTNNETPTSTPPAESASPAPTPEPIAETPTTEVPPATSPTEQKPDELSSIIDKLEEKTTPPPPPSPVEPTTTDLSSDLSSKVPTTEEASAKVGSTPPPAEAPSIPDFPASDAKAAA